MITLLTIVALTIALVFTAVAMGTRRHWLVTPAVLLVAASIVIAVTTPFDIDAPWGSAAIALGFGALGVLGGSPIVGLVLRFAQGGVELGDHGGIVVDEEGSGTRETTRKEILRGGATIGFLERLALIGTVVAGQAAAIAIIVAVKGLGRFSELDDSEARERFIIGTLTSLIWAGACAAAAVLV
jgi:hypothetical protein